MKGADSMINVLKQLAAKFPDRVAAALYQIAQQIMTEAKRRCPVAPNGAPKGEVPGTLRASGKVWPPERSGRKITVLMSFGGAADAYALSVHETMSPHDPPSWVIMYEKGGLIQWTTPGTGDHFLVSVINEYMTVLPTMLAAMLNLDDESVFTVSS